MEMALELKRGLIDIFTKTKTITIPGNIKNVDRFVDKHKRKMTRALNRFFKQQKAKITPKMIRESMAIGTPVAGLQAQLIEDWEIFLNAVWIPMVGELATVAGKKMTAKIIRRIGGGAEMTFNPISERMLNFINTDALKFMSRSGVHQVEAVREAIRLGLNQGLGPLKVSRIFKESVGLTEKQMDRFVYRYYDNLVKAKVDPNQIGTLVKKRMNKLSRLRRETIARTETSKVYHQGNIESVRQSIDNGLVKDAFKIWHTSMDEDVRPAHVDMEGESQRVNDPFSNGSDYPDDINERCTVAYTMEV